MSYLNNIKNLKETIRSIEIKVCLHYGVEYEDIFNRMRSPYHTQTRFAIWCVLNKIYNISANEISRIYGYDHTTVLHGIKRAIEMGMLAELGTSVLITTAIRSNNTTNNKLPKN